MVPPKFQTTRPACCEYGANTLISFPLTRESRRSILQFPPAPHGPIRHSRMHGLSTSRPLSVASFQQLLTSAHRIFCLELVLLYCRGFVLSTRFVFCPFALYRPRLRSVSVSDKPLFCFLWNHFSDTVVIFDGMIRSIEENGLRIYGFAAGAKKDALLSLNKDPAVSYIHANAMI